MIMYTICYVTTWYSTKNDGEPRWIHILSGGWNPPCHKHARQEWKPPPGMNVNTRDCLLVWIRRCWWNHSAELPFFLNATPITMAAVCRRFQGISKFSSWEVNSLIPWFRMLSTTELKTIILSNDKGAPGYFSGMKYSPVMWGLFHKPWPWHKDPY